MEVSNDNNNLDYLFELLSFVLLLASLIFNFIIIFFLVEKTTIYSQLMRKIIQCECIFFYSRAMVYWINENENEKVNSIKYEGIFFKINEYIIKIIKYLLFTQKDKDSIQLSIITFTRASFLSCETITLFYNTVLCYEVISLIKYPIAQRKNRIIKYQIVSSFLVISIMSFTGFYYYFKKTNNIDDKKICHILFMMQHFLSLFFFIIFVVCGITSIAFLLIHFWKERMAMQTTRKMFIVKHSLYVAIYILAFSFIQGYLTYVIISSNFDKNKIDIRFFRISKLSMYVNLFIGILLFPTRLLETQLIWACPCFKERNMLFIEEKEKGRQSTPLSACITRNMTLEVICCILYGINHMFQVKKNHEDIENMDESNISPFNGEISFLPNDDDVEKEKVYQIKYKKLFNHENDPNSDLFGYTRNLSKSSMQTSIEDISLNTPNTTIVENIKNDHDAIIIEYYPKLFKELRTHDDITNDIIVTSLNPSKNQNFLKSLVESKGKSGSFFFFSSDKKFIIKTISPTELETLSEIFLNAYTKHISKTDTVLAKLYGIYTIVINEVSKVDIILMQNLINCDTAYVHCIFDLKGSTFQRKTDLFYIKDDPSQEENMIVLKDLDFILRKRFESDLISIPKDSANDIITRLEEDTKMLMDNRIIDYSLLLVVIKIPEDDESKQTEILTIIQGDAKNINKTVKSSDNKFIYIFGIIDYLQEFNLWKKMELYYKKCIYRKEGNNASVQPPDRYAERFVNFIKDNFINT